MDLTSLLIEKLAESLVVVLIRSAFGDSAGTVGGGLTGIVARLVKNQYEQRKLERQWEEIGERIVQRLEPRFQQAVNEGGVDVPKVAAAMGVVLESQDAASALLEYRMQPDRLADAWRRVYPDRWGDFNDQERLLFDAALDKTARYLIELAAELPGFPSRFAEHMVRVLDSIVDDLGQVLDRVDSIAEWMKRRGPEDEDSRFEADYRRAVIRRYNYMELLGADIPPEARRHPLSIAYVSLTLVAAALDAEATVEDGGGEELADSFEVLLDGLCDSNRRLLLRGEAGSGKSTLFRWCSLQAAGLFDDPDPGDRTWRTCIPFLIRLRDYPEGRLPAVDDLPGEVARNVGSPPAAWVRALLDSGRALVLFDGVDEVPPGRRDDVRQEIEQIVRAYPLNWFLVSTRPAAVPEAWLAGLDFCEARINPMSAADRDRFIEKWHAAVAEQLRRDKRLSEPEHLDDLAAALIEKLQDSPAIARLATNPLLCGIICALHRDRQRSIPDTQVELCEDLCKMLLHRREEESHLDTAKLSPDYARLTYGQKKAVAQELAHFMVRNEESSVTVPQADDCLREALSRFDEDRRIEPKIVRDGFLERSGLLRESEPGRLDFIHNTLKEYLAGERFAALGDVGQLIPHALEPNWQPTILFAAASATPGFADRLVERLLNMDATSLGRMRRWLGGADPSRARKLFAVRCGEMALHLEQGTRQRLKEILKDSNRPLTISESESFAALGDFIVPHLVYDPSLPAKTLVACVRSLTLIGTPAAKNCLKTYCGERRTTVVSELKQVLDPLELLVVQEQLEPILQHAPSVREELQRAPLPTVLRGRATLEFDSLPDLDLTRLTELTGLRQVHVLGSPLPASLDRLAALNLNKRLQGRVRYVNSIGMHFSPIPAGEFVMGASDLRDARQHRVRLTQPFLLGVFPVTQAEYQRVMGENPSRFDDDARRPVECVSWDDAQEFCRRMSEQEGVTYRLPTEAEWEYACRAGSTGAWCFGDDESQLEEYAWYAKNSGGNTHAVGQKKSNAWGLHDMHGNVWEWCSDGYYANSPLEDPKGPERTSHRVNRGGSWGGGPSSCRSAFRVGDAPEIRYDFLGFRPARSSAQSSPARSQTRERSR